MPREHKQVPGSGRYKYYTDKILKECEHSVKSGDLTHQNVSKEYKIPKSVIKTNLLANILNQLVDHQPSVLMKKD